MAPVHGQSAPGGDAGARAGPGAWAVGIVHYESWDDLEACLAALARQRVAAVRVRVYDVDAGPTASDAVKRSERRRALAAAHPDVEWLDGPNIGFAAAANALLRAEAGAARAADWQMILNADVELDADHLETLSRSFRQHADVAIAGGKLLRPGRRDIDSAGIRLPAHARPRDRGIETPDDGRFDAPQDVFGVSGAAMALRTGALDTLALCGEVFDEDFFMYHEDTDLCWRAHRLGWRVRYEPAALAVHRRGWQRARRFETPAWIRRHSFKNHYLQLVKNETASGWLRRAPALAVWELLRLGFVVLRDRAMLPAYGEAWRALPRARAKRRLLALRA
jgi:GT2 family glycosyltransferase